MQVPHGCAFPNQQKPLWHWPFTLHSAAFARGPGAGMHAEGRNPARWSAQAWPGNAFAQFSSNAGVPAVPLAVIPSVQAILLRARHVAGSP